MEPNVDHETMALAFANALSFLLQEGEGIVAQGENSDKEMLRFLVWRAKGKIRVVLADEYDKPVGTMFFIHESAEDCILAAALSGGEFII
jgi:hypothetical protein